MAEPWSQLDERRRADDARARRRAASRGRTVRRRRLTAGALVLLLAAGAALAVVLSGRTSGPTRAAAPGGTPVAAGAATVTSARTTAAPAGPSPRDRAAARERRAVDRLAKRTWFVTRGGRHPREVALTFDDGPGPYTGRVLDVLRAHHVPATFFPVGFMIGDFPDVLHRQVHDGFVIGDHTENHMNLAGRPRAVQRDQITTATQWLAKEHAPPTRLFRPPYGAWDGTTRDLLRRKGMLAVFWSVDSEDWRRPGVAAIVHNVLSATRAGGIVLMHDAGGDRSQTIAALPAIIKGLRARGYRLVTVPRLLADAPPRPQRRPPIASGVG